MELLHTQVLAESLMKKHGIWEQGWRFQFDRGLRRFGCCMYGRKIISLSRHLVELNNREDVQDVILHEIAHAIAGFNAGHGMAWKLVCIRIGARPERCYDSQKVERPKLKYYAKCGGCGREHQKARMRFKGRISCRCQEGKSWDNRVLLEFKQRY
jgi:predicted SprT family Zn-dependent metalloprotease